MMLFVNQFSEIFIDVGQHENVRKKVVIVIIFIVFMSIFTNMDKFLLKNQIAVAQVFCSMGKFIATTLQ